MEELDLDNLEFDELPQEPKIDTEVRRIINKILLEGRRDLNPRPKYEDGTPAHTLSYNHETMTFDLSKGEFPAMTLRPVPFTASIKELLWIYRDASNDLKLLRDKYGVHFWDQWALEDDTIGACYGETVRRHNLMHDLLDGIEKDPDGRRHIISMWQVEDFKDPHALKPCCYQTVWNVRHEPDGDYLDMCMFQRSADFAVAASTSNQVQYAAFLCMVANHFGYKQGKYTWFCDNVQLYDRHCEDALKMIQRDSIPCKVYCRVTPGKSFWDLSYEDVKLEGYPLAEIREKNPQIKFELGI